MRKDLYKEMYQLEATYWWHVAKRNVVKALLEKYVTKFSQKRFVDVGCGTGKFLEEMKTWKSWKELLGLDGSNEALKFTKQRKIATVKKADFEGKLPLKNNSVDVITSLDVVEHIQDDLSLINEFYRILTPKGIVIITVPAHQWLWTYWDEILGHKRRHTTKSVTQLFTSSGFRIEKISYFYSYLLPMAMIFRALKTLFPSDRARSDFIKLPTVINRILINLSIAETKIITKGKIPIGLSVVCVARKAINNKQ